MLRSLYFVAPVVAALAGAPCYAAAQHDVAWYLGNRAALQSELATCSADPGDLANTPDCINASYAEKQLVINAF